MDDDSQIDLPRPVKVLGVRLRVALTIIDQFLSSAQNLLLIVLIARQVSTREFGAFTLVYAVEVLIIGIARAGISEPILLRYSTTSTESRRDIAPIGLTVTIFAGAFVSATACVIAALSPAPLRSPALAMGACLLGLLLLDAQRFLAITWRQIMRLLSIDLSWVVLWLVSLLAFRPTTAAGEIDCWGLSATAVAVAAALTSRSRLARPMRAAHLWSSDLRRHAASLTGEFVAMNSAAQISTMLIAGLLGFGATGGIRAAQDLLNPVSTVGNAMRVAIVPEVIRAGGSRTRRGRIVLTTTTTLAVVIAALTTAIFVSLPDRYGRRLLGATWPDAHHLMLASGVYATFLALTLRANMGLRSDVRLHEIARVRTISATVMIVSVAAFAAGTSVYATAWAFAGVAALQFFLFEYKYRGTAHSKPQADVTHN